MNRVVLLGRLAADPELRTPAPAFPLAALPSPSTARTPKLRSARPIGSTSSPGETRRSSSADISRRANPSSSKGASRPETGRIRTARNGNPSKWSPTTRNSSPAPRTAARPRPAVPRRARNSPRRSRIPPRSRFQAARPRTSPWSKTTISPSDLQSIEQRIQ